MTILTVYGRGNKTPNSSKLPTNYLICCEEGNYFDHIIPTVDCICTSTGTRPVLDLLDFRAAWLTPQVLPA